MYCIMIAREYRNTKLYEFLTNADGTYWYTDTKELLATKLSEVLKQYPINDIRVVGNISADIGVSVDGITGSDILLTLDDLVTKHNEYVTGGVV